MAMENISFLVEQLWLKYYDAEEKKLRTETKDPFTDPVYKVAVDKITFGNFSDAEEKKAPNFLIQMLNLMGFPQKHDPSPAEIQLALKFRCIFWSNVHCYKDFLLPLLLKPKLDNTEESESDTQMMDSIFKSFESFHQFAIVDPKLARFAHRVLNYAFEEIPLGSNPFNGMYLDSKFIERDNKRVDVAYNHLLNSDKYYKDTPKDEVKLKNVLEIRDPNKNQNLYEIIKHDQQEKAEGIRRWLRETFPRIFKFFSSWNPVFWVQIQEGTLQRFANVRKAQVRPGQETVDLSREDSSFDPNKTSPLLYGRESEALSSEFDPNKTPRGFSSPLVQPEPAHTPKERKAEFSSNASFDPNNTNELIKQTGEPAPNLASLDLSLLASENRDSDFVQDALNISEIKSSGSSPRSALEDPEEFEQESLGMGK